VVDTPAEAEGAVWLSWDPAQATAFLAAAPGLRWVQLPAAGIERFFEHGVFDQVGPANGGPAHDGPAHDGPANGSPANGDPAHGGPAWTAAQGIYGPGVAEHALALLLAGLRQLHERSRATSWGKPAGRSLFGGRVTILGAGGITQHLLRLLEPFGVDTTVVRRKPEPLAGATRTIGLDRLHDALPGADGVVVALALTPDTVGVIAEPELRAMEGHAWLVNVARGRHVVTDDLVRALDEGWIGGAALDVTDPEPLPDGHPLWGHPRCLITPHSANTPSMTVGPLSERIRENVRRFGAGEELLGLVDFGAGY